MHVLKKCHILVSQPTWVSGIMPLNPLVPWEPGPGWINKWIRGLSVKDQCYTKTYLWKCSLVMWHWGQLNWEGAVYLVWKWLDKIQLLSFYSNKNGPSWLHTHKCFDILYEYKAFMQVSSWSTLSELETCQEKYCADKYWQIFLMEVRGSQLNCLIGSRSVWAQKVWDS